MNMKALSMAALVILSLSLVAPTGVAHVCTEDTEPSCNVRKCPDGEAHDHRRTGPDGRPEYCRSAPSTPAEGKCRYYGIEWPALVCALLEIDVLRPATQELSV